MAVKIVRQPNQIAVIGAPVSAGSHNPGTEKAPAALRAAGLVERLREAGFQVTDFGDIPTFAYRPDEESPRARNLPEVVKALNALRPQIEVAAKTGALLLVLGGECMLALATIAGLRRYYRGPSLLWVDCDADLNVPATSPSGVVNGMVVAHIVGRGAPELVRFFSEPPLVREPDVLMFGVDRLDPPEAALMETSPMKRITAREIHERGAAAAAELAVNKLHADSRDFVLHFDVDFISSEDMPAVDFPGTNGVRLEQARTALETFVKQKNLLAMDVTSLNPERDVDGSAAKKVVDLLIDVLSARLAALGKPAEPVAKPEETPIQLGESPAPAVAKEEPAPEPQAWSSEMLEAGTEAAPAPAEDVSPAESTTESTEPIAEADTPSES